MTFNFEGTLVLAKSSTDFRTSIARLSKVNSNCKRNFKINRSSKMAYALM